MLFDADVSADGNLVHFALFSKAEPINFEDAMTDQRWVEAMTKELKSIEKNQVWELVSQPKLKKPIDVTTKKTGIVARGFLQKARWSSIKLDLWLEDFYRKLGLNTKMCLHQLLELRLLEQ